MKGSEIDSISGRFASLWQQVGHTAMVELRYRYQDRPEQSILAKIEHSNLTGSIKDRMALYILEKAYQLGTIKRGDKIIEATSGNTGIAFASIGRQLGHPVKIIMPDWLSKERKDIMRSLGAEVQLVSREAGGFKECIRIAEMMAYDDRVFLPRQFENIYNAEAHEKTTGREIVNQLLLHNIKQPFSFIAGVGTGGTIMGVGRHLKKIFPHIKLHPLEPAESPTLSTGIKNGHHRIQGISDEFIPAILELNFLNEIIQVNDGDAILMAQKIGQDLGLAVGISSGINLLGAIKVQLASGNNQPVITVFPDSNFKYLSTDLMNKEPVRPDYLSPHIQLLSSRFISKI